MTDNRTTELLCKLLEERGVSCRTNYLHASWCVGPKLYDAVDNIDGTLTVSSLTPEQAVAATLGSEPDETELTQIYDAGFRNGVMAVFQQLEGVEDYEGLQDLIAEYWGEGEGYDEP